ncbi:ABC transporter ATP-binding protein [Gottschalkia acidurici 9a]|uniref:ABC transporter ATP-binding protein n=1 Tax=Gottschalkia acidurici (strain ATCC 7906 / DSM 604 / BCRC 14475 / CIP 104303 / KCTC 5404 / NCIMB 10678 / 9a) TaxID=1128398 RepID=K0AYL1_GOTA9|nr:ABC transporter ATP-binding protein [Gottschalkia acidurici]AFS77857.1 ABC transporter ATP-binding protein [Gottschalkia acidurici 9a]
MNNIKKFLKIIFKGNKLIGCLSFGIMLIICILDLLTPQLTKMILDDAIKLGEKSLLMNLIIIYAVISIISALSDIVLGYINSIMQKRALVNLKIKLLRRIGNLSGDYYTNVKTGNILSIIENDISTLKNFGADILFSLIIESITALIALIFLIRMEFDLLLMIIVLQILIGFSQSKFAEVILNKTREVRKDEGNISGIVQEYISNIINIVLSKSNFMFFQNYINKEKELIKKSINLNITVSSNIAISSILNRLITICIYGYGGLKVIKGQMTIGELIAFQQYANRLIGPCMKIIRSNAQIQQSIVSMNRIFSIIEEPITINQNNKGKKYVDSFNGDISFNEVSFFYEKNTKVIDNINIRFEKGKVTALVGSSGCGKSTIVKLLFRLWDVDDGNIFIDNISLKNYNLKYIRKNISIVTQDLFLFDDTVLNNLTLGNKNICKERVIDICKRVGIYNLILNLSDGFNTRVGENGIKLSGGQKQRISIARTLLSNPKIVVFDEATSALDNISQKHILENIREYLMDKTTIIIAHRLSTIKDADNIYVLDKGKVIEEGNHEELIENEGYYYNLLNEQCLETSLG